MRLNANDAAMHERDRSRAMGAEALGRRPAAGPMGRIGQQLPYMALAQYNVIFPDLAGIELSGADKWQHE
jgi:hypothetical protein